MDERITVYLHGLALGLFLAACGAAGAVIGSRVASGHTTWPGARR